MKLPCHSLTTKLFPTVLAAVVLTAAILFFPDSALASGPAETVIYSFQSTNDANTPHAGLVADRAGNLYGTTFFGAGQFGFGTVFKLSPPATLGAPWTESILLNFSNGQGPWAPLIFDRKGNLYGTTWLGGNCGGGVVFELSRPAQKGGQWTQTVLFNLGCGGDVNSPQAGLVFDQAGNLYGTASAGGAYCVDWGGCGGVYQLVKPGVPGGAWSENLLYSFPGPDTINAGAGTQGGLAMDAQGALYGTTVSHGGGPLGTVFQLKPPIQPGHKWRHSTLYVFQGGSDGIRPRAGVTLDAHGNLYGTTGGEVSFGCTECGTVFQLTPTPKGQWTQTVLYRFQGGADGSFPASNLIFDGAGSLYGTTLYGGDPSCDQCGTVFKLAPPVNGGFWTKTTLHSFAGGADGNTPAGGVAFGKHGALYGPTVDGGTGSCLGGCGAVYAIKP
jgi:uncharacterized repeat protein (TIGR03803 family)